MIHSSTAESAGGAEMDFSHTAEVGQSAAYDATVANSPDPEDRPAEEGAAIRRHYAGLLVLVRPMSAPQGRPVIDVTTFSTLAKLAERYGLEVLHLARSDVETFVVHDENFAYRYRAGGISVEDATAPPVNIQV